MKTKILFVYLFLQHLVCIAQKEGNIWHFGNGFSLDFNSSSAVQTTGSAMQTTEGCASYCDYLGNLLFYSNGGGRIPATGQDPGHIWNKNNGVMYDMQGLEGGGFSAAQSSVIIPAPGESNVFYLFTVDEVEHYIDATPAILASQPNGRGFRYFKIDMNLNAGAGGVTQANVQLYDYSLEGLCAIRHANETDYWILINQGTIGIGVYKVTPAGVTLNNVYACNTSGIIKASPNNSIFGPPCCNRVYCAAGVFEFDITSGVLSNPASLGGAVISAEFSHNGFYLYTSEIDPITFNFDLFRYDISAAFQTGQSLLSTRSQISQGLQANYMQMAPDGKIYFVQNDSETKLGTINCPNSSTPDVTLNVFNYGSAPDDQFYSLPNFPSWIFYNFFEDYLDFGPDTILLCPGDSFLLDAGPGTFWSWGGDCYSGPQNTWPDNNTRYFTITQPGTYSATLTGFCPNTGASDQITVLPCAVSQNPCGNFLDQDSIQICSADTIQLQVNIANLPSGTQVKWIGGGGVYLPSDTVPEPQYIPTAAEIAQGSMSLVLNVTNDTSASSGAGRLLAYDRLNDGLVFSISTLDGSIDTLYENDGLDWLAMGYESSSSMLYGKSLYSGFTSLNALNGDINIVQPFYIESFYAGDFDNVNGKFYTVGNFTSTSGLPEDQFLALVNTTTGNYNYIGNIGLFTTDSGYYAIDDGFNGLAYDPGQDVLYGVTYNGKLYQINVSTAAPTLVGNTQPFLRGLAYDFNANKLWGISSNATLFEIDKNNGSILSTVNCQVPFGNTTSLTYASSINNPIVNCYDTLHIQFVSNISSTTLASSCTSYAWNGNTYTTSGTYNTFFPAGSSAGCDSTAVLTLTITGLPTLTASSVSGTCGQPNGTATATATGGAGNYAYSWSNGATGNFISGLSSGSYSVVATDQNGCSSTSQVIVSTTPAAGVTLTVSDTILGLNETAVLEILGGDTYNWTPSTGLSCDDCFSVIASPSSSTTYTVTGTDSSGCQYLRVINVLVDIVCSELFVPNIFSPNGIGNAENEKLCVYSDCIKTMNLGIYNRWGELIFSTDNQKDCWDGT
ncbi:MAG: gliding motility-associated C-terminal domain-containing protein, partial [Bacteroidota bacterium]